MKSLFKDRLKFYELIFKYFELKSLSFIKKKEKHYFIVELN